MVFTYLIFYLLLLSFLIFFLHAGFKKGKNIYTKYKKMDEIYDKYENLRSCRRELVVKNNFIIINYILSNIIIGLKIKKNIQNFQEWKKILKKWIKNSMNCAHNINN